MTAHASALFAPGLFKGRVVAVTGGGSGINLGIADTLASLGADVAICGRTASRLEAAAEKLRAHGGRVLPVVADVRDFGAQTAFLAEVEATFGPVSTLVCGAAGNFLAPAEKLSSNGFRTVIEIDLIGSFNSTRAAFDQLRQTRGNIVYVSAGQGFMPYAFQAHAGAAKAGIEQMMRNLALEWGPYGIRVNSVAPGPIADTEGLLRLANPAELERFVRAIPLQRLGEVGEIGQAVAFLASPLSAYITGTQIVCDGGQNLAGSGLLNHSVGKMLASAAATGEPSHG
ncbi:SDR family oxidoreductase [Erythrobacter sp. NE805]|uniref:SDR family oxidoreductase n=1 Tax=Erythrobacter sp. NE805 TaxID=3389875 RepID=UPI00396AFEF2